MADPTNPDDEPFLSAVDSDPIPKSSGPRIQNDPTLVEDAARFAERHWPETGLATKVRIFGGARRQQAAYWLGDIQAALTDMRNAALNRPIGNPWGYLRRILDDSVLVTENLESLHDPLPRMPQFPIPGKDAGPAHHETDPQNDIHRT